MAKKDKSDRADRPTSSAPDPPLLTLRRMLADVSGARLCFGEPIRSGEHATVSIARMRTAGGGGFGSAQGETDAGPGSGGGGGGYLEASPVGFLEIGPEGTRFVAIPDPDRPARLLGALARLVPATVASLAGVRALRSAAGGRGLPAPLRRRGPGRRSPWPRRLLGR